MPSVIQRFGSTEWLPGVAGCGAEWRSLLTGNGYQANSNPCTRSYCAGQAAGCNSQSSESEALCDAPVQGKDPICVTNDCDSPKYMYRGIWKYIYLSALLHSLIRS